MSIGASDTILIIGTGAFGLSTAWHLARRGYKNVVCLDRFDVPSKSSAASDTHKSVRMEDPNIFYAELRQEALAAWKDPLWKTVFHQTGRLFCTHPGVGKSIFDTAVKNARTFGDERKIQVLENAAAIRDRFPLLEGPMKAWRGIFNAECGWVESGNALRILAAECKRLGVRFHFGESAAMKRFIRDSAGKVMGIVAEDGTEHKADTVVLAAGSWSDVLLDFEGQLVAGFYGICQIQLSPEEAEKYSGMPVCLTESLGDWYPPNASGIVKGCRIDTGNTNMQNIPGRDRPVSVPRDIAFHPTDTLPIEAQDQTRSYLRAFLPELAERPFQMTRMCWDTETFDFSWIISSHPSSPTSLFVATGGCGNAVMNLPTIGGYVVDCMEGKLTPPRQDAWRWRPEKVGSEEPVRHVDLKDLTGWKHDKA